MTDLDRSTELIVGLAKAIVAEMRASFPQWSEAFVRLQGDVGFFEVKGSFVMPSGVQILNVLAHKAFVSYAQKVGAELRETLAQKDKLFCVAILRVGSDLNYDMQYEYSDPSRWRISKMDGGTGMPVGYVRA